MQTDQRTDRRYQVHYLHASLRLKIGKKTASMYMMRFYISRHAFINYAATCSLVPHEGLLCEESALGLGAFLTTRPS